MFAATSFAGKRVAVFGLARSGIACASALALGGAKVFSWDDSEPAVANALAGGVSITNLMDTDFAQFDALVLSPGVPLTHPEPHWTVAKARAAGIEIVGDTEIFQRELQHAGARLVAITGTNGKSTTTALIGHVLRAAGLDAHVGGNIGLAVFNLPQPDAGRIYVLELSSFQIDLMPSLKPDVAILTNITPDHLDRHGDLATYAAVKARMFARMNGTDLALISVDDPQSAAIEKQFQGRGQVHSISVLHDLEHGISASEGVLRHRSHGKLLAEMDLRNMPALKGRHNWQNACMAFGTGIAMGVGRDGIEAAMHSFPGLAHRMQEVGHMGRVSFVNDSKATNADAAEKALSSFTDIYWIAGGVAKAGGIDPLLPLMPRVVRAYLIGEAADLFKQTLAGHASTTMCDTLENAVIQAAKDARRDGKLNAVVLLSPACASFDQYRNFELRGEAFVRAVANLPDTQMNAGVLP